MTPIRQRLCNYFCTKEEPEMPFTILQHRTRQHIIQILQKHFPDAQLKIRDREYSTLNLQEFNYWIQRDCISERKYYADWHDCDDFADAIRCKIFKIAHTLKTSLTVLYCEGYIPAGYHAFNMLIDDADGVYIVEPQDDNVVLADKSVYLPDFIQL